MSLHQSLGGNPGSDEENDGEPVVLRSGVDCIDRCPECEVVLEIGSKARNFSLNMADLSILVDCQECGLRVRLKGVLGPKEKRFLTCL